MTWGYEIAIYMKYTYISTTGTVRKAVNFYDAGGHDKYGDAGVV